MVDAPVCHEYGFFASPYRTYSENGKLRFNFINESAYEGELIFDGIVDGETITGTYIWKKDGRKDLKYKFSGKLN